MRLGIQVLSPRKCRLFVGLIIWAVVLLVPLPASATPDNTETFTTTNEGGAELGQPSPPVLTINEDLSGRTVAGTITTTGATFTVTLDDILRPDIAVQIGPKTGDTYPWNFVVPDDVSQNDVHLVKIEATKDGTSADPKIKLFQLQPAPIGPPEITPIKDDPVLKEKSAVLSQPFPTPKPFTTAFLPRSDKPLDTIDTFTPLSIKLFHHEPIIDRHVSSPAVTASDQGWKILGIAWYWWVLIGLAVIGLRQAAKIVLQRYQRRKAAMLLIADAE